VGGRPGRVVPAQADADRRDPPAVDVVATGQPLENRGHDRLEGRLDRQVELRLALAGAVEGERRDPAAQEERLEGRELLLDRVEPGDQEDDRRPGPPGRPPQVARQRRPGVGDRDRLGRRVEQRRGPPVVGDRRLGRGRNWAISSKKRNLPKWWQSAARAYASPAEIGLSRRSASAASRSCRAAVRPHSAHHWSQRSIRASVVRTSL
jgi:hypothetical protein